MLSFISKIFQQIKAWTLKKRSIRFATPHLLQLEATECGAVALAMVLGHYGYHLPLDEARVRCGVSRNGSKASHIINAARHYGLIAKGYQVDTLESLKELSFPYIVFWEFDHFVVVEGYNKTGFFINDPARGQIHLPYEIFSDAFTGIVLHFEPGPDFKPGGQPPSIWQFFFGLVQESKQAFLYLFLLSLLFVVPTLISVGFIKIFIDDIVVRHMNDWLRPLIVGMVLTACVNAFLQWLKEIHLLRLSLDMILTTALTFVWHVLRLPIVFFYQRYTGDIITRIEANDHLLSTVAGGVSSLATEGIVAIIFAIILLFINTPLALIVLLGSALDMLIVYRLSKKAANRSYQYQQLASKFFSFSLMGIKLIESVKAMSSEISFLKKWRGLYVKTLDQMRDLFWYENIILWTSRFIDNLTNIIILGLGVTFVLKGHMTIGSLVAFQGLMGQVRAPFSQFLGHYEVLQSLRGDLLRLEDAFQHKLDKSFALPNSSKILSQMPSEIQLKNVVFGYSAVDPPEIKNVSIHVDSGKALAIVGRTGSGKSTLASLILGFYEPWEGEVSMDQRSLGEISAQERAQIIGFVDSDCSLWEGTVLENLNPQNNPLSEEQLYQAIQDACAEEIVSSLGGLEGGIQEGGRNLSGGQRQRMELARALAQNPSILVLDEATSAMDTLTEMQVVSNLKKRSMTLIMISHRLSAVRDADEILVFDEGAIVEKGTHDELMGKQGKYYELMVLEQ